MGARSFTNKEQKKIIVPLADELVQKHTGKTMIIGMQGGQGTGKSTITAFLEKELRKRRYGAVSFSIDDFYSSWKVRKRMQQKYSQNPFYQIPRGMPGTHRVKELCSVLKKAKRRGSFIIPQFDKSLHKGNGDISKKTVRVRKKVDFVLFEGWCVGLPTVSSKELVSISKKNRIPLRKLDPELRFHKVVLNYAKKYQTIWDLLDYMVVIKPDSSSVHKKWRLLQEKRMRKEKKSGMSVAQVSTFVEPYLPFTYVCYDKIRADAIIKVDRKHNYYKIQFR